MQGREDAAEFEVASGLILNTLSTKGPGPQSGGLSEGSWNWRPHGPGDGSPVRAGEEKQPTDSDWGGISLVGAGPKKSPPCANRLRSHNSLGSVNLSEQEGSHAASGRPEKKRHVPAVGPHQVGEQRRRDQAAQVPAHIHERGNGAGIVASN